jgi:TPR repeat protein
MESYQRASGMGYRMANYNLGLAYADGDGVTQDYGKAEQLLKTAADAGVQPAGEALAKITFSSADFSNPEFFQAIYDGDYKSLQADPTSLATYVSTFVDSFAGTPGCGQVLSNQAMAAIRGHVSAKVMGMFLGGAAGARHDHAAGDFAGAAGAGARAGDQLSRQIGAMIDKGKSDAQLFYSRYSCDTPVANRFFNNLDTFSRMLGSPNFMKELEKHVK